MRIRGRELGGQSLNGSPAIAVSARSLAFFFTAGFAMSARIESWVFSAVSFFSGADDGDGVDAPDGDAGAGGPGVDADGDAVHSVALLPTLVVPAAHQVLTHRARRRAGGFLLVADDDDAGAA